MRGTLLEFEKAGFYVKLFVTGSSVKIRFHKSLNFFIAFVLIYSGLLSSYLPASPTPRVTTTIPTTLKTSRPDPTVQVDHRVNCKYCPK